MSICTNHCPEWHFTLGLSSLGPICTRYSLPIDDARDKCYSKPHPKGKYKKQGPVEKAIQAKPWPGALRGFGPLTMELKEVWR